MMHRGQASDRVEATRRQYLDELMDAYVSWREACGGVAAAHHNWKSVGRRDQKPAFCEYIAALNCEEEAATSYQRAVEHVAALNTYSARQAPAQVADPPP